MFGKRSVGWNAARSCNVASVVWSARGAMNLQLPHRLRPPWPVLPHHRLHQHPLQEYHLIITTITSLLLGRINLCSHLSRWIWFVSSYCANVKWISERNMIKSWPPSLPSSMIALYVLLQIRYSKGSLKQLFPAIFRKTMLFWNGLCAFGGTKNEKDWESISLEVWTLYIGSISRFGRILCLGKKSVIL